MKSRIGWRLQKQYAHLETDMKKAFHIYLLAVLLGMTAACVEELPQPGPVTLRPSEMELLFTSGPSSAVTVSTKSDMGEVEENTVHNLYVFVFDGNGKKVFGYFFDSSCHYPSEAEGRVSEQNNWWTATGLIHLSAALPVDVSEQHSTCTLVGIANVDDERMGVSAESLGLVLNLDDLSETATRWVEYDQKTVFRSGYFLMCDSLNNVVLNKNSDDVFVASSNKKLELERLDAKVSFYVQVLPSNPGEPVVASFTPLKWQVFNVPSRSYLLPHGTDTDNLLSAEDFFDTAEMNFETDSVPRNYIKGHPEYLKYGFTFYMLENHPSPKVTKDNWTYADREMRGADSSFLYTNDLATYVVLTGRLQMEADQANATLGADVSYLIHLGDFGAADDFSNFSVERNHHYKYTIYIRNAEDIRLQAEGGSIIHPGASGHVLVARNELYTCDAHYASHVFTLKGEMLKNLIQDASWYVETPFGAGSPDNSAINQLDYKWVEFRVNTPDGNGGYLANRAQYQPHADNPNGTMYIDELIAYLKDEMTKRADGIDNAFTGGDSINITAFVNEFYYTRHPISGAADPRSLWKQFVNKPMRRMCMLDGSASDAIKTYEGSESIGTVFTIQQKSIQTVYNINHNELYSAWGCEHLDEADEHYSSDGKHFYMNSDEEQDTDRGNTSMWNGRDNSFRIWDWRWETVSGHTHIFLNGEPEALKWEDYLNLTAKNGEALMNPSYQYVRYECMSRNRDNDGDGYIDRDEVRWYMAATNQLIGLYLGWHGIEGAARLYQRNAEDLSSSVQRDWRQRVLSSTRDESNSNNKSSDKYPRVIWAEQGVNGSNPTVNINPKEENYSTRCLRNLGSDGTQDVTFADTAFVPQPYLTVHRKITTRTGDYEGSYKDSVYYEFDCSYMNTASLRGYTDNELVLHDENSEASFLYSHFVSAPRIQQPTFTAVSHKGMNDYLDANGINPYCPEGYRLPNVRELSVYRNLIPDSDKKSVFNTGNAFTRSYWSLGSEGLQKSNNEYGWAASNQKILMTNRYTSVHTTATVRCVKDVR